MKGQILDLGENRRTIEALLGRPPMLVRSTLYLLVGLFGAALVWSYVSRVEIHISAPGAVRPKGDLVPVQPSLAGRIAEVFIQEGDRVEKGHILFKIDSRETDTRMEQIGSQIETIKEQRRTLKNSLEVLGQKHEIEARKQQTEIDRAEAEKSRATIERKKIEAERAASMVRMETARKRYHRNESLWRDSLIPLEEFEQSDADYRAARASRDAVEAAISVADEWIKFYEKKVEFAERQAEIAQKERELAQIELENSISSIEHEIEDLESQRQILETRRTEHDVKAPISGRITGIICKRPGQFVQMGKTLAEIAPDDAPFIVEAFVKNRDAGFLRQRIGKRVRVKFDAFPFHWYGTIDGELIEVAADATVHHDLGLIYRIETSLPSHQLSRGQRTGTIELGMTATVEIIKSEERIISLLIKNVRESASYD